LVFSVRRSPGTPVRRRTQTHGQTLLHQLGLLGFPAQRRGLPLPRPRGRGRSLRGRSCERREGGALKDTRRTAARVYTHEVVLYSLKIELVKKGRKKGREGRKEGGKQARKEGGKQGRKKGGKEGRKALRPVRIP